MEIPHYPASRPLALDDKPLFDAIFSRLQPRVSELTFAGLYLFRHAHDYLLTLAGDAIVVRGRGYDSHPYFLPPLDGDVAQALGLLFHDGLALYGADDGFAGHFLSSGGVLVEEDRDSADYLYSREDLASLPGNRFHKKKNRINYFMARHSSQTALFSPEHQTGCLSLLDAWYRMAEHEGSASLDLELEATAEALVSAGRLGLEGVVVTVDGAVRAFALGERLNRETAVCHFEKSDPFMEGLSQLVNREFCRLLFSDCRFVNREQDLGEAGLRNAKLSYHPLELVRKFRARL